MAACCCEAASAVMREAPLKRVADYGRFRTDEQSINHGGPPGRKGAKPLILLQLLHDGGRRSVKQFEEDGVRPPEAADIDRIAGRDAGYGRSCDHVVLFPHG